MVSVAKPDYYYYLVLCLFWSVLNHGSFRHHVFNIFIYSIHNFRKRIVSPVIDSIDASTFEYHVSSNDNWEDSVGDYISVGISNPKENWIGG